MASLVIDIITDSAKAVAGFNQVGTAAKKQAGTVTTFGTKAKGAFTGVTGSLKTMAFGYLGAGVAVTALGGALVDASKAAMEDERSQALLAKAMENNLGATKDQVASMEEWIDKTSRAVGVADDELRPALSNLIIAGMDAAGAQRTLGVALDIAAAKGLDVETVSKALAKAYQGNVGGLAKLGIATKDTAGETLDFEEALDKAAETMGGSAAVAAATLEGRMKRAKVAVDEAKESVGGWVNVQLADAITGVTFLNASMDQANKGNELFAIGIQGVRAQLDDANDSVAALAGGLVFAANKAVAPTTEALMEQVIALGLTEGETRKLSKKIDELAKDNELGRKTANEFMGALNDQADAMGAVREDGRLLSDRYHLLRNDAEAAREKAAGYRRELTLQGEEMRKLVDPIFALREAQRGYNTAFERWSELAVSGKGTADELAEAEDNLTEASLEVEAAELAAESGGKKMKEAWAKARAEAGLLEDATWGLKEAIDQWSKAVTNAPRWNPGTGTTGGPTPLAAGGIVTRPTLALIGEAGPEAVVPLRRGGGGARMGGMGSSYTLNLNVRRADANDIAWGFKRLELLRG